MRTKRYGFPLKANERLAMKVFCDGMKIGDGGSDEGFPKCFRNDCVLGVSAMLLGFRDPIDFVNQVLDRLMAEAGVE